MNKSREYVRRIFNVVNGIEGVYDIKAKWMGVKANTLYLLYALDDGKEHTQKEISKEWLIPRTTLNTIIKECEADGYITLKPIPGYKRDLHICLTETGKSFAKKILSPIYNAEKKAISKTLQECSPTFIADLELFCNNLKTSFQELEELG